MLLKTHIISTFYQNYLVVSIAFIIFAISNKKNIGEINHDGFG